MTFKPGLESHSATVECGDTVGLGDYMDSEPDCVNLLEIPTRDDSATIHDIRV